MNGVLDRNARRAGGGCEHRAGWARERLAAALLVALMVVELLAPAEARAGVDRGAFEQGLEVALAVRSEIGFIDDEEELHRVYDLGARIAWAADDEETVYTYYLVDMPEPNAFAVPGGYIFITKGMLDLGLSDDALAHLLGHEVAHVRNRHASRIGLWDTITSILQTAAVITVAAVASSSRPVTYRDEYGREFTRLSGGTDALVGASVMSTVFRELFLRGYSRGLETEADAEGAKLATAAGFPAAGGVEMLESLHQRVYEGVGYSYWRTHPFFDDRVTAARGRLWRPIGQPDSAGVAHFRKRSQARLAELARRSEREDAALLIYRNALRWGTQGVGDVDVQLELVRFRAERAGDREPLERNLGPLLAELDDVETELAAAGDTIDDSDRQAWLAEAEDLRADLAAQLDEMLPRYQVFLDTPGAASNAHLESFTSNFPEHERAAEARLALARRHLKSGHPELAIPVLMELWQAGEVSAEERIECLALLDECAAEVTELSACYEIVDAPPDSAIGNAASTRMEELVADLEDLELGGRFLKRWGETPYTEDVRQRVEELARAEERFGRVFEAGGKPQRALDIYNRVVLLAPQSGAALDALEGIERIHNQGEG